MSKATAYAELVSDYGPGRVADAILAKWRADPDGHERSERLDAVIAQADPRGALSHTQFRVLRLLANGYDAQAIGGALGCSPETIRTHRKHVRQRLGARTDAEAVAIALLTGLLEPDEIAA